MGFLDMVQDRRGSPKPYVVVITDSGKSRLDRLSDKDARWAILNYLMENGPAATIRAMSEDLGVSSDHIKSTCRRMSDDGYVVQRPTGGGVD